VDTPAAEVEITRDLVHTLIADQHPDLLAPLTLVAEGWDNVLFRLGDDHCIRLPRRLAAAQLIINEQRWLPLIATFVPAPIPAPVREGRPDHGYPWSWSIVPWLDGTPAVDLPLRDRANAAAQLAEFMAALHVPAPLEAPVNPVRGVPLAARDGVVRERLTGELPRAAELLALWERLMPTPPWTGPRLWLHGDPHSANLLLARDGTLAAVIDFGDLTSGDPATDLAAAWLVFDPQARAEFRAHYDSLTGIDDDTWRRAHAWAVVFTTAFSAFSDDNPTMAAIGSHVLEQVLLDED
jgi:aminoglycoside phosphotransferase (APT) family kinase protein